MTEEDELRERCAAYEPRQMHWQDEVRMWEKEIAAHTDHLIRLRKSIEELQAAEDLMQRRIDKRDHALSMLECCNLELEVCRTRLTALGPL